MLDESAIAPDFVKLAPEVSEMFEWAHMLHRQIYDILADERIPDSQRDARVASCRVLSIPARPGAQLQTEGHGADGRPTVLTRVSKKISEVQRAHLVVSLVSDGAL